MKLIDIDKQLVKKYYDMDKTVLYLSLVPYKNNTRIKAYTEEGEPIGDIEESFVPEYLSKDKVVMFINQSSDDETGLFEYTVATLI